MGQKTAETIQLEQTMKKLKDIEFALNASTIVAITDARGIILDVNEAFCRISQYSRDEIIGQDHRILNSGFHDRKFFVHLWKTIRNGQVWEGEVKNRAKDGSLYWVKTTIVPFLDEEGKPYQYVSIRTDISEVKRVKEKLMISEESLTTLIDSMPDFVCFKDGKGRWIKANQFALSLYHLEEVDYRRKTDLELISNESARYCIESDEETWKHGKMVRVEEILRKPNGESQVFDVIKVPVFYPDGERKGLVVVGRDITERKRMERVNEYLAYSDPLTDLPNRRFFEEKLESMLMEAKANQKQMAVLFLDLDRFKYVNDSLGHAIGDRLLQSLSQMIMQCRREKDFVARMGGDEFTVLIPDIRSRKEVVEFAERLVEKIRETIAIDEYELFVTASIGISFYPSDGEDAQTLIKNADAALHRAKEEGKNRYHIYNSRINNETIKTFSIENELRRALHSDEFLIYYQPRVDIASNRFVGAEALIRWNHPEWGLVSPGDFIPLAEETGLIIPLGEWIIQHVSSQIKEWQEKGMPRIPISINISAKRFMQRDFVAEIVQTLDRYGIEGNQIELEVTETSVMNNPKVAQMSISKLNELGIKVALDDFGTGYSSLSYLTQFSFHTLKIDRSFIRDLSKDSKVSTITTSIIQIAKGLGMETVAEGVETEEQLSLLKEYGCEQVQGFLFSKPVPANEYEKLVLQNDSTLNNK